jgi:hypothetical protein
MYVSRMSKTVPPLDKDAAGKALLMRELEKGLASGVSKRSPEQIRAAFRKAREAACCEARPHQAGRMWHEVTLICNEMVRSVCASSALSSSISCEVFACLKGSWLKDG